MPIPIHDPSVPLSSKVVLILGSVALLYSSRGVGPSASLLAQVQICSALLASSAYLYSESVPGRLGNVAFFLSYYVTSVLFWAGAPLLELGGVLSVQVQQSLGLGFLVSMVVGMPTFTTTEVARAWMQHGGVCVMACLLGVMVPGQYLGEWILESYPPLTPDIPPPSLGGLADAQAFLPSHISVVLFTLLALTLFQYTLMPVVAAPQPEDYQLLFEEVPSVAVYQKEGGGGGGKGGKKTSSTTPNPSPAEGGGTTTTKRSKSKGRK